MSGHILNFYKFEPHLIKSATKHQNEESLAILRKNDTVDIFDCRFNFILKKTLIFKKSNLEQILYVGDVLYAYDMENVIHRIEDNFLVHVMSISLEYGLITCLDWSRGFNKLAFGTKSGRVFMTDVKDNFLVNECLLQRQTDCVNSILFNDEKQLLIGGCGDSLKVWDLSNGTIVTCLTLPSPNSSKITNKPIIRSILNLSDGTVATGDSKGSVTFWNINPGFIIQSLKTHQSEVLSLTTTTTDKTERNRLFSGGMDGLVVRYEQQTSSDCQSCWNWASHLRIGSFAVVALESIQKKYLFTATLNGSLTILRGLTHSAALKISPVISLNCSKAVQRAGDLMVMGYDRTFDLWEFSKSKVPPTCIGSVDAGDRIICLAADKSSNSVAFSTLAGKLSVAIVENVTRPQTSVKLMECGSKVESFVRKMALESKTLCVLCSSSESDLIFTARTNQERFLLQKTSWASRVSGRILNMELNFGGSMLAVADSDGNVFVFTTQGEECIKLPRFDDLATCMCFHPTKATLCLVFSLGTIVEFDCAERSCKVVCKGANLCGKFTQPAWTNCFYDTKGDCIFMSNADCLGRITKENGAGIVRRTKDYSNIVSVGLIGGHFVIVEVLESMLTQGITPFVPQKTFGM